MDVSGVYVHIHVLRHSQFTPPDTTRRPLKLATAQLKTVSAPRNVGGKLIFRIRDKRRTTVHLDYTVQNNVKPYMPVQLTSSVQSNAVYAAC